MTVWKRLKKYIERGADIINLSDKEREVIYMGTRSTIAFIDNRTKDGKIVSSNELVRIYQQYDGYPSGVGLQLANWLKDKKLINGFGDETAEDGYCNGVGCMSAQFIHDFKDGIGGLYITDHDDFEEYNYKVIVTNDSTITLKVYEGYSCIFEGSVDEFIDAVYDSNF